MELILFIPAFGQKVTVIKAFSQTWSGGIAGRYGTKYKFEIEFAGFKMDVKPDTIWVENTPYPISVRDTIGNVGNAKKTKKKNSIVYDVFVDSYHDEYSEHEIAVKSILKNKQELKPPIAINGVALLSYEYYNERHYFTVKKFTQVGEPINYP